ALYGPALRPIQQPPCSNESVGANRRGQRLRADDEEARVGSRSRNPLGSRNEHVEPSLLEITGRDEADEWHVCRDAELPSRRGAEVARASGIEACCAKPRVLNHDSLRGQREARAECTRDEARVRDEQRVRAQLAKEAPLRIGLRGPIRSRLV